jgi:hypothetical protein
MKTTVELLRDEMSKRGIAIEMGQVFDLLEAVACEQCCTQSSGGNGSCPPPKKLAE